MTRTTINTHPGLPTPTFGWLNSNIIVDQLVNMVNEHAAALDSVESGASSGLVGLAPGDGVTYDDARLQALINSAVSGTTRVINLQPGVYRLSKYLDLSHVWGLRVVGYGVRIIYPSDGLLNVDAVAVQQAYAQSAFLVRYCSDVTFEGITFQGGTHQYLPLNQGLGVAATNTVGLNLINCNQLDGGSLYDHATQNSTAGTGVSLTAAAGQVTVVATSGLFQAGHGVGCRYLTINNATDRRNAGTFRIARYVSPTTVVIDNPDGVTEVSAFRWTVDDNDRGTYVEGGWSYRTHANCRTSNEANVVRHRFMHPDTGDLLGIGDALAVSGSTVTLTDQHFKVSTRLIGKYIKIAGATTSANNGTFPITAATQKTTNQTAASIQFTNAAGVAELYTGDWWIPNGDKVGLGAGVGALAKTGTSTMTLTSATPAFAAPSKAGTVTAIDTTAETFTCANHGLLTGEVIGFNTTGTIPGGLALANNYYAVVVDANTFKLSTKLSTAFAGTGIVNVTSAGTGTLTFANVSGDVGKQLTIHDATSANNEGTFTITAVISPTQVMYQNSSGVAEDFADVWTLDAFDHAGGSGDGFGGSHFNYLNAGVVGRSVVNYRDCIFMYGRQDAIKDSGTAMPLSHVSATGCVFIGCCSAGTWGSDDSQEHNNQTFSGNTLIDCATQRWGGGTSFSFLGSRLSIYTDNKHYYTQNHRASWLGSIAGSTAVSAGRYLTAYQGQPIEGFICDDNRFFADPDQTKPGKVVTTCISASRVGQRTYWDNAGTLTKSGTTMTLTDSGVAFSAQMIGRTVEFVFSTNAANDGEYIVTSCPSSSSITFENAAGVAGAIGGTWRLYASKKTGTWTNSDDMAGVCLIRNNVFDNIASTAISTTECLGPVVTGNATVGGGQYIDSGSLSPYYDNLLELGSGTSAAARIQLNNPCWPIIGKNRSLNPFRLSGTIASRGDFGIGIGNTTIVDFPLQGNRGRALAADGYEQLVFAYGAGHVDGDVMEFTGSTFTYRSTIVNAATEFNSQATLIALISGISAGSLYTAADYGMIGGTNTCHILVKRKTRTTTDGNMYARSRALNATALVCPRNDHTSTPFLRSRGCAAAGPVPYKYVVWSPVAAYSAATTVIAENAAARTILTSGGYLQLRNSSDAGACAVIETGTRTDDGALTDLGSEIRWTIN